MPVIVLHAVRLRISKEKGTIFVQWTSQISIIFIYFLVIRIFLRGPIHVFEDEDLEVNRCKMCRLPMPPFAKYRCGHIKLLVGDADLCQRCCDHRYIVNIYTKLQLLA